MEENKTDDGALPCRAGRGRPGEISKGRGGSNWRRCSDGGPHTSLQWVKPTHPAAVSGELGNPFPSFRFSQKPECFLQGRSSQNCAAVWATVSRVYDGTSIWGRRSPRLDSSRKIGLCLRYVFFSRGQGSLHILGQICGLSLRQRRLAPDRSLLGNQENEFLAHGEPNECLEKHSSVDKTGQNLKIFYSYKTWIIGTSRNNCRKMNISLEFCCTSLNNFHDLKQQPGLGAASTWLTLNLGLLGHITKRPTLCLSKRDNSTHHIYTCVPTDQLTQSGRSFRIYQWTQ